MDESFSNECERLLRALKNIPEYWKADTGRPSSAAFKDSNGVSVDREGERVIEDAVDTLVAQRGRESVKGVVSVTVNDCKDVEALLKYAPLTDNQYHSEIHKDQQKTQLTRGQLKKLADRMQLLYKNESVLVQYK